MNNREMITLKEFPKYPIQLWIQPSRLEICRPKENVEIPQNRNGIKLNNFFETFFYFFPDSTLPKHVENPKGTAFCSVKDGGIMIMEEVIPKEPKAEELRNIAKIINQLFKNADERFSIFWRSFNLFIEKPRTAQTRSGDFGNAGDNGIRPHENEKKQNSNGMGLRTAHQNVS